MAVFEDEYSAVVYAFKMIEAVHNIPSEEAMNLKVGIGIASGEVISGDIGSKDRRKFTVVGDTVHLASRLSSIAPPNSIYIAETTRERLKDRIDTDEIKGQKIKGKSKTVSVYIVKTIKVKKR